MRVAERSQMIGANGADHVFARTTKWATLALGFALAGCLAPEASQPALDVPPAYAGARIANDAPPRPDWWHSFGSPELVALSEEAAAGNLDVTAAVARIQEADAQVKVVGASLLPQLSGAINASRSRSSALGGSKALAPKSLYEVGLSASWEIDFWGKNRALRDAAQDTATATRFDAQSTRLSILASVANAYFQILSVRERARLAREDLQSALRVLKLIQDRLAVGTGTALDEAQQQSIVANLRASIPPFEQVAEQSQAALAVLLGRPPERLPPPTGTLMRVGIPRVTPGIPSDLLTRRPDILSAEAALAGGDANVYAARAAFFPTIDLTGSGGFESLALQSLFQPSSAFGSIAAGLMQPIFQGFRLQGSLEQAQGRQAELLALYRRSVISAFSDVERSLSAIKYLARQEALERQYLASSRRAFEISETRLREGTIDLVTLLNTQTSLFQAQDALVQTRLARLQAAVSLFQALGGGWTDVITSR